MKSNGAWLPTDIRTKIKTEAIANEDITELSTRINDHKSTLNTTAHLISNISGLQGALDGKLTGNGVTGSIEVVTSVDFAGETVTTATISYSDGLITGVV